MTIENVMADAIIGSREFCGNERQAAIDAAADDYGRRPTVSELSAAFSIANAKWTEIQAAAGVTAPISPEERAQITRIMDRAS